jgi:hypothetical protein
VLGAAMGSVPEIVVDGVTGFTCATVDDAVARVPQLAALSRAACRERVVITFSTERMVDRYLDAYRAALALRLPAPPSAERIAARDRDWWERPMAYTDDPPHAPHQPYKLTVREPHDDGVGIGPANS